VPVTAIGTTGSPASMASWKMPLRKRPTFPSALRVPSGNTMSECPPAISVLTCANADAPGLSRCTSTWPARRRCHPMNGNAPSDAFAMIRMSNGTCQ
jgi:hypothetical protein